MASSVATPAGRIVSARSSTGSSIGSNAMPERSWSAPSRRPSRSEAPELHAEQPARDVFVESAQRADDRGPVGLTEQDAPEGARVDVDAGHPQPRARRLSARYASVVPAGAPGASSTAAIS